MVMRGKSATEGGYADATAPLKFLSFLRLCFDELKLWSTAGAIGAPLTIIATATKGKITVLNQTEFDNFVAVGNS
jgi:hypothetical protein